VDGPLSVVHFACEKTTHDLLAALLWGPRSKVVLAPCGLGVCRMCLSIIHSRRHIKNGVIEHSDIDQLALSPLVTVIPHLEQDIRDNKELCHSMVSQVSKGVSLVPFDAMGQTSMQRIGVYVNWGASGAGTNAIRGGKASRSLAARIGSSDSCCVIVRVCS